MDGLCGVIGARLADHREDLFGHPPAKRLSRCRFTAQEDSVDLSLSEQHSGAAHPLSVLIERGISRRKIHQCRYRSPFLELCPCVVDRTFRVLETSRTGHLGRNEQQVVFRVPNEDIKFDAPLGVNYRLSG